MVAERVRLVAARFREVGDELAARRVGAVSALRDLGAPWGTGVAGDAFARGYPANAEKALRAIDDLSAALTGIAAGLAGALRDTQEADRTAGESFRALRTSAERDPG